jgi:hypothetical protein
MLTKHIRKETKEATQQEREKRKDEKCSDTGRREI